MIEQLKTLRAAIDVMGRRCPATKAQALTALTQLEAMVGEQKPVAYAIFAENGNIRLWATEPQHVKRIAQEKGLSLVTLYAAPVAQQYEAGDMASAAAQGFRDGVASVAQPQEPVAYYYQKHNCFGQLVWNVGFVAPGDATHCYPLYTAAPVAQQPQAERDLKDVRCECCGYMTHHREHMGCIRAAIDAAIAQQKGQP